MNYKKLWIQFTADIEFGDKTNWGKIQLVEKMKNMEVEEAREAPEIDNPDTEEVKELEKLI